MQEFKNQVESELRKLGAPAQLASSMVNTSKNFLQSAFERQRPASVIAQALWKNHNA